MSRAAAALSGIAIASLLVACAAGGGGAPEVAAAAPPAIASVHKTQCGRCHAPPDPGSHSRDELQAAFGRHGKRVHLSQDEWQAMVEYLAPPAN